MGCSVALFLARNNIRTVLIDAAPAPFTGASRWNEGKIHLGYLYAADPTLATARKLIPGGLSFRRLIDDLLERGRSVEGWTQHNDTYLIHRDSVTDAESAFILARQVSELTLSHPESANYFVSLTQNRPRQLSRAELEANYDTREIVAGFQVPERSMETCSLADEYCAAVAACTQIEPEMERRVVAVRKSDARLDRWLVETVAKDGSVETLGPFAAVVNALWEGRGEIDATVGLQRAASWTHRYRVSMFAKTRFPVSLTSAVIAVGPFGDIKNYDGNRLYLSWYEAGLLCESHALRPPRAPQPDDAEQARICNEKFANLGRIIPAIADLRADLEKIELHGGWVHAAGQGALSDPASGLHRRDNIGQLSQHGYFSVDTGKFSVAPLLAQQIAASVSAQLGVK